MSWHFWQFRIWEAQAPTSGWFDSSSFGTRNQVIARLNPTVTCKEPARRFWSGGTFLVRRAILGAARVYGRTLSKRSSQLIVIFPLFKALVVHLYWHLYTATAGLGQDLWASKFGLSWLQSLFSFLLYFWERNLEHHRYLASVFGISISHSSASYPLVTLLTLSYLIGPLIRTTLLLFPSQPCLTLLLIPRTQQILPMTPAHPAPAFPPASHQASHPLEIRPHPLQSPSYPLLSLPTPRSHLPRFHPPSFPCIQLSQHKKPSQSRAPNSPIRALRALSPAAPQTPTLGTLLRYPALPCSTQRSSRRRCWRQGWAGWAG